LRVLISGICGFVGSSLARELASRHSGIKVFGFDNFSRPGSEINRTELRRLGIDVIPADARCASDIENLLPADALIDAAASCSVLAGVEGRINSRQLLEHNLIGTVNLLEYCRRHRAIFTLLSTSRVYSIEPLAGLRLRERDRAFILEENSPLPVGITSRGVTESFSTFPPVSLYGSTKIASEQLALEYGSTFSFPVWVNRCGLLAGAGQFGRADQGIVSFWIHSWLRRRTLNYIGFEGTGFQTRDLLHPRDLVPLLLNQWTESHDSARPRVVNVSGGTANSFSLAQLSRWCEQRFGPHQVGTDIAARPFDIGWLILDSSLAGKAWNWRQETERDAILEEIALHAETNKYWLDLCAD
jgi:CDP-paratose 2-epimerase